jgi:hypothetical protein
MNASLMFKRSSTALDESARIRIRANSFSSGVKKLHVWAERGNQKYAKVAKMMVLEPDENS